jgi:hypothetical protein
MIFPFILALGVFCVIMMVRANIRARNPNWFTLVLCCAAVLGMTAFLALLAIPGV